MNAEQIELLNDKYFNVEYRDKKIRLDISKNNLIQYWDTPFNNQLLNITKKIIFDIPTIGMQYWLIFQAQNKEYAEKAIEYLFGIKQTFGKIALTDEEFAKLLQVQVVLASYTSCYDIYSNTCKALGEYASYILVDGNLYIFAQISKNLLLALVHYGLLYKTLGTHISVVLIPEDIDLSINKIFFIPPTDLLNYYNDNMLCMPSFTKSLDANNIAIKIQPEWVYFID